MIQHFGEFGKRHQNDIILFCIIVLISLSSFALGRMSAPGLPKTPIEFTESAVLTEFAATTATSTLGESPEPIRLSPLVASRQGKYYYTQDCPAAKRLSEKNKIFFASIAEARARGYLPSKSCLGLE